MTTSIEELADRMAVTDVIVRYFAMVDAKEWDRFGEVFTADTTARWSADTLMRGLDNFTAAISHMAGTDEVVTHHTVGAMAPTVDGDHAEVTVKVRAMHFGVGPRAGLFYESCGVQPTRLVRTPGGWRIAHHDWVIAAKFGNLEELFAPERAAGTRH